ncbi:MAG: DegV family protein [Anaerolineae bacterium]|nr:DegV family protein [Anaerolineae bacterium]
MKKIAIVTDTDSSLPEEVAQKYDIRQVPITIHFGDDSYITGTDIDDRKVFEIVDRVGKIPTTAAPSPGAFAHTYEEAFAAGADALVCVCVSSQISATYSAAVSACEMFPGKHIRVIDSRDLSMGQGYQALAAAEAAQAGANLDEIAARVADVRARLTTYAVLPTLKYLALSGRVGKLAAGMAATLSIKPILTVREGKLELLERIRTQKIANQRVLDLVQAAVGEKTIERYALIHVNNLEGARELKEKLGATMPVPPDFMFAEFTPGLSVHAGAGVVGVVVQTG